MGPTTAGQPRTREAHLARQCFWLMLLCSTLARLAARFAPALETPLLVAAVAVALVGGFYYLTDPGPPRAAKDGA